MIEVRTSEVFDDWLGSLRDRSAKFRIEARIRRISLGNAGDVKFVGEGVSELRIDYGLGYRVCFTKVGKVIVLLLCGGDKSSQTGDIARAITLRKDLEK